MKYSSHLRATLSTGLLAAALFAPATGAQAAAVTLVNPGFEDTVVADGVHSTAIPGWTVITGNTLATDTVTTYNPTAANYTAAGGNALPAPAGGANALDLSTNLVSATGVVTQQTSLSLTANTTYTLTVAVGNPLNDFYHGYTVSLTAGGTVLNFISANTTPKGAFQDVTLTYTPNLLDPVIAGLVTGQDKVTISLSSGVLNTLSVGGTASVNFDNVRLDASPAAVPEPSTIQAVAVGLAALGTVGYVRRRRSQPLVLA